MKFIHFHSRKCIWKCHENGGITGMLWQRTWRLDSQSPTLYILKISLGLTWMVIAGFIKKNRPFSQIPECTCSISHNAPLRTEMCTFLFSMEHCGYGTGAFWDLWIRSIGWSNNWHSYAVVSLFSHGFSWHSRCCCICCLFAFELAGK